MKFNYRILVIFAAALVTVVLYQNARFKPASLAVPPNDPFYGIHYDFLWEVNQDPGSGDMGQVLSRIRELNIGSVRMPIRWAVVQDVGVDCTVANLRPHTVNMQKYRDIINQIPAHIEILSYLETPPPACVKLYGTSPDAFALSYANYVRQVVTAFKDRVHHWEIWNEVNNNDFYLKPPYEQYHWSAWDYTKQLLRPAFQAIRSIDPQAKVLAGAFSLNGIEGHANQTPQLPKNWDDTTKPWYLIPNFLRQLLTANSQFGGAPNSFYDGISLHPYHKKSRLSTGADYYPYDQTYGSDSTASALRAAGVPQSEIYWTEFGVNVAAAGTEDEQAIQLNRVFEDAIRGRNLSPSSPFANYKLKKVFWYSLRDYSVTDTSGFGLINKQTQIPRKSFFALKDFIANRGSVFSVIDRFDIQRTGPLYSRVFWTPLCPPYVTNCDQLFWGTPEAPALHFSAPEANWGKTAIISRPVTLAKNGVIYKNGLDLSLKANMFGWQANSNSEHYILLTLGGAGLNQIEQLTPASTMTLQLRRVDKYVVSFNLSTADSVGTVRDLIPWRVADQCQNPNFEWMIQPALSVKTDGSWNLVLKDSTGQVCFTASSTIATKHSINEGLSTSPKSEIAIRLMGMTMSPRNSFFKFTDVHMEAK